MKETDLTQAREFSRDHRESLSQDTLCGCFYCLRVFEPKEIIWESDEERTASCPYCGMDSVIGESSKLPITKDFLKKMRTYWFTESE